MDLFPGTNQIGGDITFDPILLNTIYSYPGYNIMVYGIKHDGRYKARYVTYGHNADIPLEHIYSGVVAMGGFNKIYTIKVNLVWSRIYEY